METDEFVEAHGGTFKLTTGIGRVSGLQRVWLAFMGGSESIGYGVFEPVTQFDTREEALAFIATPPPWWGRGCATCSGPISVGPAPHLIAHHVRRTGAIDHELDALHPPT